MTDGATIKDEDIVQMKKPDDKKKVLGMHEEHKIKVKASMSEGDTPEARLTAACWAYASIMDHRITEIMGALRGGTMNLDELEAGLIAANALYKNNISQHVNDVMHGVGSRK